MSKQDRRFVRLVPLNPKAGYTLARYMVHGNLYMNAPGKWYTVPLDIANKLAEHTQPSSELRAFDICTEEERLRIDKKETKLVAARTPTPTDFTSFRGEDSGSAVAPTTEATQDTTTTRTRRRRTSTTTSA